ncbi:hypothetical protein K8M07_12295 [Schnuerera sp. xch1]|uniref:hypothetical protein n=1 Tax=Schnuerera sp. xch1 TaxID=2874283 RepID=UPI001CBE5FB0|nr:hypothetical protein [Schnuerera sp. xch1]MBZ2176019.1 hypothetical protein [Schnuerera sp. xch1]
MYYKNINLDENIIIKNRIPLLIDNENWIELFQNTDNKNIQQNRDELIELVKRQKNMEKEEITLKKEKNIAMKMILGISDAINNGNKTQNLDLLDEYKEKMENTNERLDDIAYKLEGIFQQIRETNFNLLKATVYYGYKELKQKEKELKTITDELESIREKTRTLINQKYDYEEWINSTYSFLHGMLGNDEMEKLDEQILG